MKKHLVSSFILIAYSAILIKVMVFKDVPIIRIGSLMLKFGGTQEGPANLVPFKTILPYLLGEMGLLIGAINLLGNIVLLMPVGFLAPFVFRNMTWKKTLVVAVAAGFFIEGMQVVLHLGIFDIDDVILNAIGVLLGYWVFAILANWVRSGKYKTIVITVVVVFAVAVASLYAIYPKGQQRRMNSVRGAENGQSDRYDQGEGKISPGVDPCNGTGGTGQIVSVGNNTITIKGGNGISQIIKLTDQTTIRNSMGPASKSDLKTGDGITVVIDGSETATLVLICNTAI